LFMEFGKFHLAPKSTLLHTSNVCRYLYHLLATSCTRGRIASAAHAADDVRH